MNRVEKFLTRLQKKDSLVAEKIVEKLISKETENFNVKKLKGFQNRYRIRKGKLRIIYSQEENGAIYIIYIYISVTKTKKLINTYKYKIP